MKSCSIDFLPRFCNLREGGRGEGRRGGREKHVEATRGRTVTQIFEQLYRV